MRLLIINNLGNIKKILNSISKIINEKMEADVLAYTYENHEKYENTLHEIYGLNYADKEENSDKTLCYDDLTDYLNKYVKELKPECIIFGDTKDCRVYASIIAHKLNRPLYTDVIKLEREGQYFTVKRIGFYGKLYISYKENKLPLIITVKPSDKSSLHKALKIKSLRIARLRHCYTSSKIKVVSQSLRNTSLDEGKIVIGIGKGVADNKNILNLAFELAKKLKALIVCSRPAYLESKVSKCSFWVGLSGIKISANTYIALGISGQVQHIVGIQNVKTIITVNKDSSAPIIKNSDYAFIIDAEDLLKEVLKLLK